MNSIISGSLAKALAVKGSTKVMALLDEIRSKLSISIIDSHYLADGAKIEFRSQLDHQLYEMTIRKIDGR